MNTKIEDIKKNESPPKIVKNIFNQEEIDSFLKLYTDLPTTVHNKKQNVVKKRWLQGYNKNLEKIFCDSQKVLVLADIFRGSPAAVKNPKIFLRLNILERDSCRHGVALPFAGYRPARFHLVHDHLILSFFGGSQHRFVSTFDQAEVGVHRVYCLSGIPENNQDFLFGIITHGEKRVKPWLGSAPSTFGLG